MKERERERERVGERKKESERERERKQLNESTNYGDYEVKKMRMKILFSFLLF